MATSFENVALVIGEEMDKAWKNIMEKLASADTSFVSASSGATLTGDALKDFFKNLGGANLAINFSSLTPKGEVTRFSAYKLTPTATEIEGSISIGVSIKF